MCCPFVGLEPGWLCTQVATDGVGSKHAASHSILARGRSRRLGAYKRRQAFRGNNLRRLQQQQLQQQQQKTKPSFWLKHMFVQKLILAVLSQRGVLGCSGEVLVFVRSPQPLIHFPVAVAVAQAAVIKRHTSSTTYNKDNHHGDSIRARSDSQFPGSEGGLRCQRCGRGLAEAFGGSH